MKFKFDFTLRDGFLVYPIFPFDLTEYEKNRLMLQLLLQETISGLITNKFAIYRIHIIKHM